MTQPVNEIVNLFLLELREFSIPTIQSAISVIRSLNLRVDDVSFLEGLRQVSVSSKVKGVINAIFEQIIAKAPQSGGLELLVQSSGFDSMSFFIQNTLEQGLWDEQKAELDGTCRGLAFFVNNIKSATLIDLSAFNRLAGVFDGIWEELRTNHPRSWTPNELDERLWPSTWQKSKDNWELFKKRIREAPQAELFSENVGERRAQYLDLGSKFLQALSRKREQLVALEAIPDFIDTCFVRWTSEIDRLQKDKESTTLSSNFIFTAQKAARNIRRDLILKVALKETLTPLCEGPDQVEELCCNPHYQNAVKQICNFTFGLGYSESELGLFEEALEGLAPKLIKNALQILQRDGVIEVLEELKHVYRELSYEEKERLFFSFLEDYAAAVLVRPDLLLDPCKEVELICLELKKWSQTATRGKEAYSQLKQLVIRLQSKGVLPSFSYKEEGEGILEMIRRKGFVNASRLTLEEAMSPQGDSSFTTLRTIFSAKKRKDGDEEIEELITSLETSQSPESQDRYFINLQKRVEESADAFPYIRANINRRLLERKIIANGELTLFGAHVFGALTKVVRPTSSDALSSAILQLASKEGFPPNYPETVLTSIIEKLNDPEGEPVIGRSFDPILKGVVENGKIKDVLQFLTGGSLRNPILDLEIALTFSDFTQAFMMLEKKMVPEEVVQEKFIRGCLDGDSFLVETFLASGAVLDVDIDSGLFNAANLGHFAVVSSILASSVTSQENRGLAAITACNKGHLAIAQLLLAHGDGLLGDDIAKLILSAAQNGHIEILKLLQAHERFSIVEVCTEAFFKGHVHILKELVETEESPSEKMRGIAVMGASMYSDLETVEFYLVQGSILDEDRGEAFALAARKGNLAIMRLLASNGKILQEYLEAALIESVSHNNSLEVVRFSLEIGSISDEYRGAAFVLAANKGNLAIMHLLASSGILPEGCLDRAVIEAASRGYLNIVIFSLGLGSILDKTRNDASRHAISHGNYEMLRIIFESGSDEYRGNTLITFIEHSNITMIKALVDGRPIQKKYIEQALTKINNSYEGERIARLLRGS